MVLKISVRDAIFFVGLALAAGGTWATFGPGPLLIVGGLLAAAAAKFLEVAPCSSNA